jgi:hypothetical protein
MIISNNGHKIEIQNNIFSGKEVILYDGAVVSTKIQLWALFIFLQLKKIILTFSMKSSFLTAGMECQ